MEKKKNKGLKVFLIILITFIVISLIITGIVLWFINNKLDKIDYIELPPEEITVNEGVEENETLDDYRTIAILGIDARNDTFTGSRSDCIILVTINNKNKEVKLTSVYRDTYLDIDGYGLDKVTHAYAYGNAKLSINTLNKNLDLNIKDFITINFDSVVTMVDAVGGVELSITDEELKYINGYINEINRVTNNNAENINTSGPHNLNGVQALAYGRIRYTDGGDYKRTERMRYVLTEVFNKTKKKNIFELNNILDIMLPHISTNIDRNEVLDLIPKITSYNVIYSAGGPYSTKGSTLDRWYGVPVTLEDNVVQLHQEVFGETDYTVSETVKEISNRIVSKTDYTE